MPTAWTGDSNLFKLQCSYIKNGIRHFIEIWEWFNEIPYKTQIILPDRAVFSGWHCSRLCVMERKETNIDRKKVRAEGYQCHASREEGWNMMKMIFKTLLHADLHPPMEKSKEIPVSRLLNQLLNQTSSYMPKIWKQNKISNLGSCKESKSVLVKNSVPGLPWWHSGWKSTCQCREHRSWKIPHATEQLNVRAVTTEACRF